jgi:hypothetical protein
MAKILSIQNLKDEFGRFAGQLFSVWDNERKEMVFLPHPDRSKAEAFISQGELFGEDDDRNK